MGEKVETNAEVRPVWRFILDTDFFLPLSPKLFGLDETVL